MARIIIIAVAVYSLAGCALGAEERRGAGKTTEAQLPGSPELYDEAEFEKDSTEIARYNEQEERTEKSVSDAKPPTK